jgi:diguanylate cyclase (GGDEF)-like protein/PAS domain S-box-containing protein
MTEAPEALQSAQDRAGRYAAWVTVAANVVGVGIGLHSADGKLWRHGFPAAFELAIALVPTVTFAILLTRGARWARFALVWLWTLAIPLLLREPFITERTAIAVFLPAALAALLAGPRTVLAASALPLAILFARGGASSAYLNVGYLAAYGMLTALIFGAQRTLLVATEQASRSSGLFEALARETNEIITITGPGKDGDEAGMTYVSPSVTRVLGYPVDEPKALSWDDVIHPDDVAKIARMSETIRSAPGMSGTDQFRMRHKTGEYRWMVARATNLLHHPPVGGVIATFVDVTDLVEEREAISKRLENDARHDRATGLQNRTMLSEHLPALIDATKNGESASLLFFDVDGFKVVNDSLGHDLGDKLIVAVSERIRPELSDGDELYRLGGDELAVLTRLDAEKATSLADKIVSAVRRPFHIEERELFVTVSVGVTGVRCDHDRPEAVLRDADVAMYRAKERGKNRVEVYDDALRVTAERRHDLEQALRRALDEGEFRLVYQPKVSAADGRLNGFEALVRWSSARLGPIMPMEFIALAEETGLIIPIGRFVLEQACEQLRKWQKRSPKLAGLKMAVNLSGRQLLNHDDFTSEVKEILTRLEVPPWDLELEITESVLMTNAEKSIQRLEQLKKLGVKIGIDDFGTGYSSLSYLRRFPIDVIKVDRAFVMGLGTSREDTAIVHLVVTLAQALGLETVAEGVEAEEQLAELKALGCDQVQGYLVSRPLEVADADAFIDRAFNLDGPASVRATG